MSSASATITPSVGDGAPRAVAASSASEITTKHLLYTLGFALLHIVLAMAFRRFPQLATAHALASLAIGIAYAAMTKRIQHLAVFVMYFAGCEVLWRMTQAGVFWEFGKYAIVSVLLVGLLRFRARRNRVLALAYFLLLVPSIALTILALDPDSARQQISFNLSGPLALTVAVIFFSNVRLTVNHVRATFVAFAAPAVGIAVLTIIKARSSELVFVNASNRATSGGFSGNQVSAILGVAAMLLILMSLQRLMTWKVRLPLLAVAAVLTMQSALTFSRGGILLAFAGLAAGVFFIVRGGMRIRITVLVVGLLCTVVGRYIIEPRLEEITGGKLKERYSSTKSSGRDLFIDSELMLFRESPILGVGPGMGLYERVDRGLIFGASHTEYTRMLAEHGILGLLSIVALAALAFRAVMRSPDLATRSIAAALVVWVLLFMLMYGMRLAAPSVCFGLAFMQRPRPPRLLGTARA
jgi:O-antigen ligase